MISGIKLISGVVFREDELERGAEGYEELKRSIEKTLQYEISDAVANYAVVTSEKDHANGTTRHEMSVYVMSKFGLDNLVTYIKDCLANHKPIVL
jgi:hypothetical protein